MFVERVSADDERRYQELPEHLADEERAWRNDYLKRVKLEADATEPNWSDEYDWRPAKETRI